MGAMEARRVGERAVLVECDGHDQVAAAYSVLRERAAEWGATDVVPAARTVLLDGLTDVEQILDLVAGWEALAPVAAVAGATVEVPVTYDGADLEEVARQWEVSVAEVVRIHQDTLFTVAFCGFAPGFAYCTGSGRSVSRRADPRPAVPAGSVGLAGEYTGIYPRSSPGGWQLIGRTRIELWDSSADSPALLVPGTAVRFVDV